MATKQIKIGIGKEENVDLDNCIISTEENEFDKSTFYYIVFIACDDELDIINTEKIWTVFIKEGDDWKPIEDYLTDEYNYYYFDNYYDKGYYKISLVSVDNSFYGYNYFKIEDSLESPEYPIPPYIIPESNGNGKEMGIDICLIIMLFVMFMKVLEEK